MIDKLKNMDKVNKALELVSFEIEEPEIKEYTFCKEDKFFVVASDGLFEFISRHDIVDLIKDFYLSGDIVGCCEYLYKLSREKWMKD